jgi:hypothetical protein
LDTDSWLGRPLPKLRGTWPGGLPCALTVDPDESLRPEMLPLEVWTPAGERLVFYEYRADQDVSRC